MTTALRTCPLCEATCGLELTLEGDRITGVRGDDAHPLSRGFLCPKGAAFGELEHDPARLTSPRLRTGDGWKDVTWSEAFAFIEDRLAAVDREHGRDSVALYLGNPNVHTLAGQLYGRAFRQALRPGVVMSASTVDQMPRHRASGEVFGDPLAIAVPDIDRTDLLVVLGGNPMMSNGSLWTVPDLPRRLRDLRARGGRLVVVDPRHTRTAARADRHLAIRPGTDAVLLAAVARFLLAEGLADLGALEGHVDGVEVLDDVLAPFTPELAATTCGLDAEDVRTLATEIAASPAAAVYGRLGTTTTRFGTLTSWLVDVVNVVTGNLDRPGGMMFPRPFHEDRSGRPAARFGRFSSRVGGHPEVLGELPVAALAEEITTPGDGQVRALFLVAGNPVLSTPDGQGLADALDQLDLMVAVDPYVTATSRHADVILPPPPHRFRGHADLAFAPFMVRQVVQYTPPVLPLPDDQMAEEEILLRLGAVAQGAGVDVDVDGLDDLVAGVLASQLAARPNARTGDRDGDALLAAVAPRRGPERLLDLLLRSGPYGDAFGDDPEGLSLDALATQPHGRDLGALEPRLSEVVVHDDGLVHLAPPALVEDLARLRTHLDTTDDASLLLVGRRHLRTNNAWMHNLPMLQGSTPLCTLQLHPDDAASLGLVDGGNARVRTDTGEIVVQVEVTDELRPGVVSLPHGFGHQVEPPTPAVSVPGEVGVNVNRLVSTRVLDPLSGTSELNGIPVEVAPA